MINASEPLCATARAMALNSSFVKVRPVGFEGLVQTTSFVFALSPRLKSSKLKRTINKYITDKRIIIDKSDKAIVNEGIKFLLKHSIISRKDDYYMGLNHELIKKYSDLINNKNTVQINHKR